ncbi:MAG: hypothetical protein H5U14_07960, partial [Roseovarius sp.]|nr:hypothetical protein [Roseovarius sp.]
MTKIDSIHFTSRRSLVDAAKLAPQLDPLVAGDLAAVKAKIHLLDHEDFAATIAEADPARDILLIWDETAEINAPDAVKSAIKTLGAKQGLYRVDPLRTRMEGSFYLWAGLNRYSDREGMLAMNHARMRAMVADIGQHEKAYVFGSGPTLSDFVEG